MEIHNKFIILSHFIKETQKTPKYEIEKARKILEDLKERGKNNEQIQNLGRNRKKF